jgi:hypothetical protein
LELGQQSTLLRREEKSPGTKSPPSKNTRRKSPESFRSAAAKAAAGSSSPRINQDVAHVLPGKYAGSLLEAIAFEQMIANGIDPKLSPELVEKNLYSISPPVDSDENMMVLIETQRAATDDSGQASQQNPRSLVERL